jgi:predicted nucleic acid-binding protein
VRKFALDTNLYVRSIRNPADAGDLGRFYSAFAPSLYLSSIVLHELLIGADGELKVKQIHRDIAGPFDRTGRIFAPSHRSWVAAGEALAKLASTGDLDRRALPRSFINDVLLAASCREAGITLVTDNGRDFMRIARVLPCEFVEPWPRSLSQD